MSKRCTHHATFVIERDLPYPPARGREGGTRELLDNLEKELRHG